MIEAVLEIQALLGNLKGQESFLTPQAGWLLCAACEHFLER